MSAMHRLLSLPTSLPRVLQEWPVTAQRAARRNAMIALTACAERRRDRDDVREFFAERATATTTAEDAGSDIPAPPTRHA
ncbi:MAG TPA: hypothetical protein VD859_03400 [Nocardioides sp.]|nr:hypothetical protein [Nocardioides sp.]